MSKFESSENEIGNITITDRGKSGMILKFVSVGILILDKLSIFFMHKKKARFCVIVTVMLMIGAIVPAQAPGAGLVMPVAAASGDIVTSDSPSEEVENGESQTLRIIFDYCGGKAKKGKNNERTVDVGEEYGKLPGAARKGYKFAGWFTAKKGGQKADSHSIAEQPGEIKLFAHWKAKTYKIVFWTGKNKLSMKSKRVKYGSNYGKLATTSKSGYKFSGWYTKRTGGKKITARSRVNVTKKTTLYARWKKTASGVDREVKGLPVLMYHQFYDPAQGESPKKGLEANWMKIAALKSHIKYLHEAGYYFPTWEEVDAFVKGQIDLPSKSVVITIDDGHKSFYRYAVPILKKYKVRGTGFIITKNIGKSTVKKYSKGFISLQSHSRNLHLRSANGSGIMMSVSTDAIKNDLKKSIDLLGRSNAFAYPFGHYNNAAVQAVREVGFRVAFSTQYGRVYPGMNRLLLPRVRVNADTSLSTFKELVK
jgi:uncharacterized repeat protein (TIGR02543 family)